MKVLDEDDELFWFTSFTDQFWFGWPIMWKL